MSYLLDTNVISETVRPRPDRRVLQWFDKTPDDALHVSVLTLGEIRKGIEKMAQSERRERLRVWLEHELPDWFEDRILPVDVHVAERWGVLCARAERTPPAVDSLLAATALHHGLRLVTRNERNFAFPGIETINPWK